MKWTMFFRIIMNFMQTENDYLDRKHFEVVWPYYSAKCLDNYLEHSFPPLLPSLEILTNCSALKILSHYCRWIRMIRLQPLHLRKITVCVLYPSLLPKWHVYQSWSVVNNHSSFPKLSFNGNFLRRQCVLASTRPEFVWMTAFFDIPASVPLE